MQIDYLALIKRIGRSLPLPCAHVVPTDQPIAAAENVSGLCVLLLQWEVSEREEGWGTTVRPDSYSVHQSPAALEAYLQAYWDSMPDKAAGRAPDCYSRPSGDPVAVQVALDHPLALALAARGSQRLFPWDDATKTACWAAEQIWHAMAPRRGWHVDRDWPKPDDKDKP
jgi:hypothetical protein